MKNLRHLGAALLLTCILSVSAAAGDVLMPGVRGDMSGPGIAGEMSSPGVTGEILTPGAAGAFLLDILRIALS
jgi:hypothetical protein